MNYNSKEARQHNTISAKLFRACLEDVFRHPDWENTSILINGEYLSHLSYADDIFLLSETAQKEHLHKMFEEQKSYSSVVGLKLNIGKFKVLRNKHAKSALVTLIK